MARKRGRSSRPVAVGDVMASALHGTPAARILKEGAIWRVWKECVGAQIASRARPASIRSGVLTVIVTSAPWLQQLNVLKGEIRSTLNAALGEEMIKDIFLKSGTLAEPDAPAVTRRRRKERRLTPAEEERIALATAEVGDPELRDSLSAFFARHLTSND